MSHPVLIHPFPYPIIGETLHSDTQGGPSGRVVKTANLSALSRSSSHRCETSQVLLAGGKVVFPRDLPVFSPPTNSLGSKLVK